MNNNKKNEPSQTKGTKVLRSRGKYTGPIDTSINDSDIIESSLDLERTKRRRQDLSKEEKQFLGTLLPEENRKEERRKKE